MDTILLLATTSLVIQFIVLALLIVGYALKRMKKYRQHGITMFSAVILHIIMILTIMIPSLSVIVFSSGLSNNIITVAMIHASFGSLTLILGIWIVASWRLRKGITYCAPKKLIMLATYILWLVAISIGTTLYLSLYFGLIS